jgi:nucleoside-diphosphate-sugar epimerase
VFSRGRPTELAPGVEHHAGDVGDQAAVNAACRGAEVVYQVLNAPYHRWAEEFPAMQRAVVQGARSSGARLVSFENVYAYGKPGREPFRENSPYAPCSGKGRVRAAMAEELQALHASGALQVSHVRASDLFGPGMRLSGLGDEVIGRAVSGKAPRVVGDLDAEHTWTFTEDAGRTIARVGSDPAAFGAVWHVPSDAPRSTNALMEALSSRLGRRVQAQVTPAWMLRLLGWFVPPVGAMVEMIYQFEAPFVVSDQHTRAALGLAPTPFAEAFAATVAWFETHQQ